MDYTISIKTNCAFCGKYMRADDALWSSQDLAYCCQKHLELDEEILTRKYDLEEVLLWG